MKTSKLKSLVEDYKILLKEVPTLVVLFHVLSIVVMNLAALKVIFNFGIVAGTGGILISWIPFLCMDTVTKRFGARAAIMINNLAAAVDVVVVLFFAIVAAIPTSDDYGNFNAIFSSTWFVVVASMVALIASGIVNSLLNSAIGKIFKEGSNPVLEFITRSYISTFIGQFVDNFLFFGLLYCVFAPIFWGFGYSWLTAVGTAALGGLLELLTEVIFSPIGYRVVRKWEKTGVGEAYIRRETA